MAGLYTPKNSGPLNAKLAPTTPNSFIPRALGTSKQPNSRPRSNQSSSDTGLFLKRVIGCSTTAFDSHPPSRSFAYTAGAAAVVVQLDENLKVTQRFFRARPNAPTWSSGSSQISALQNTAFLESRNRLSISLKDLGIGYSLASIAAPMSVEDSPSSKTWTARERIKAATCVSFSPDGKWLAAGEVRISPSRYVSIALFYMQSLTFGSPDGLQPTSPHIRNVKGYSQ